MAEEDPKGIKRKRIRRVRQCEYLAQRCIDAFERSQKNEVQITTQYSSEECEQCKGSGLEGDSDDWCAECNGDGRIEKEIVTKKVVGKAGDSSHMRVALEAFKECSKLQGLHKEPKKGKEEEVIGGDHYHWHGGNGNREVSPERIEEMLRKMSAIGAVRRGDTIDVEVMDGEDDD
jgi:hypothetical protein